MILTQYFTIHDRFEPGLVPICSVIRAMGMVASCNPFGMVPFIKLTLSVMLPMLDQVHDDAQRQAFCFSMYKISSRKKVEYLCRKLVNICSYRQTH